MALRKVFKIGAATVLIVAGGGVTADYFDFKPIRSVRVVFTTASIIYGYKKTFIKYEHGTPEYCIALSETHTQSAKKLYNLCCKNKGTYIKLGQMLGALDYILPREYTSVLKAFHDDAPGSTFEEIKMVIKEDLGLSDLNEIFSEIEKKPIGTASLAQVHKAKLKSDGSTVAVKVQHPKVREQADFDMYVTEQAARIAAKIFPEFKLVWLAEETKKHLPLELDFLHEGKNAEKVARHLKCFRWIKVPKIYWEFSSRRVLVMEFCEGGQVNDLKYFKDHQIDSNIVSKLLGKLFSEMIFVHGFVHCDPHPGNVLVKKRTEEERRMIDGTSSTIAWIRGWFPSWLGGKPRCSELEMVLLDHGLYQTLDDEFRYQYAGLWQGLIKGDVAAIKKYSNAFGVGDMYPLFATMVTVRSWEIICSDGLDKTSFSDNEDRELRTNVPGFLTGISEILNTVPRQMVMLFKTNDLLRMLEVLHGTRSDSSGFLNMSRCCLRALREYEDEHTPSNLLDRIKNYLALQIDLAKISAYEWFIWIYNSY